MNQSLPLYDTQSALVALKPWLEQHLPDLDPGARQHVIQLVTEITEQHSLLLREIAASSVFQAEQPESNYTQVQRIIRDTRLTLETVYYPFLQQLLATIPGDTFSVTLDDSPYAVQMYVSNTCTIYTTPVGQPEVVGASRTHFGAPGHTAWL